MVRCPLSVSMISVIAMQRFSKSDFRIDPGKETGIVDFSSGKAEEFLDYLFVCCLKENAVHIKTHIQDLGGDSLVSVYEGMIHDQSEREFCNLVGVGRIQIHRIKGLERRVYRGVQHPFVTDSVATAEIIYQLLVDKEYVAFGKIQAYLANSS